jgi:hypothetical protein
MLDGLPTVDWASLEHAYGSAADVPDQLRALTSADPEEREDARWHLFGNIVHQGSRYQASAYAVPFLLELLADPATQEPEAVLELLTCLAIGYDQGWLPGGFPVDDFRGWVAESEGAEHVHANQELLAYDAVRRGVPLFRQLLTSDVPALRTGAAYTLAWFPEEREGSVPALANAAKDADETLAATALVALGLIGDSAHGALVEPALDDDRPPVRWAAAVALARLRGPAAGERVSRELLAWSSGKSRRHQRIQFLDGDLAGYASRSLRQLGDGPAGAAYDALLSRLPHVSGVEALAVLEEALRRAFPAGALPAGTPYGELDRDQRRLLQTLAGSPRTWRFGDHGVFGNFSLCLTGYNLPGNPDEMRAYTKG